MLVSCPGVFGALTSRSRPSRPPGWWAAQGHCGSCAGSGQSDVRRSTAASCGWVCCIQGRHSPTDTEPHARSTAAARRPQSETKPHRSSVYPFGPLPCSLTDISAFKIIQVHNTIQYVPFKGVPVNRNLVSFSQVRGLSETRLKQRQ